MNKQSCFFLSVLFCISCNSNKQEIPVLVLSPEILVEEVFAQFPGRLIVSDDFISFQDVRSVDSILHVYDKKTGEYKGSMGIIGNGPDEFITPRASKHLKNNVFIRDSSKDLSIICQLETLPTGENLYSEVLLPVAENTFDITFFSNNEYLTLNPENDRYLFRVYNNDELTYSFGQVPLDRDLTQENIFNLYNGEISYNPYTEYLLCRFTFPLIHLYKKEGNGFVLSAEKKIVNYEFREKNGAFTVELSEPCRTKMSCLTKNYVVLLDDSKMDREKRKSFKSPVISRRQLILLDYDLKEKKVIDLNMDIFSIGADEESDTLYLLVANPDYMIVKIEL